MAGVALNSGSVTLRALEPVDVDLLYEMENDTSVWHVSNTFAPFSRFQAEQYVLNSPDDIYTNHQLRLMIDHRKADGQNVTVGCIDLFDVDFHHLRAGIGILVIGQFRKSGIARSALAILIQYAFTTLGLHQLYGNIAIDNEPSIRLFEQVGFQKCGIKRDWLKNGRKWKDECIFQLINDAD